MDDEDEEYVYQGNPTSFRGSATTLTLPLGYILKEVAEEILEDRFLGNIDFGNKFLSEKGYLIALYPRIQHFEYRYNQLNNIGFAITPEVNLEIFVEVLDGQRNTNFKQSYKSGYISGDTYMISGSPGEKINKTLHKVLCDLLKKSFEDAKPSVQKLTQADQVKNSID